ncbi:hypothetical protein BDF22DRAFT_655712 [Syncephalis plumigaleata]|nr:hypothetical protein BDF22DRAFT_655712 [Syncephalis plumigaleata]
MSNHLLESSTGDKLVTESGHYRTPANSRDPIHPPISHPTAPPSVATSPVSNATNKSAAKADVPLRDILEQYTNNEDILRLVLTAKIEEDKRYAAQANAQAEQAKLESRRVELEIVQSQQLQQQQHSNKMLPTHPGRPTPPDVKRSHSIEYGSNSLPQMNNYTPSTQSSSTHRSRGSPENDNSFFGRASNGSATTSNTTSSSKLSSYAPPSFTDCLAFSPADITHMPPLPVSSSGPSDSPALSRSRSAYTTGRQTEGNNSDGGNGSDSALTPTTLKRRQHEEAMRTIDNDAIISFE